MYDSLPPPDRPLTDYESAIYREALAGFPGEQDRISKDFRVLNYYNLEQNEIKRVSTDGGDIPVERLGLTRRCVDLLCSLSYNPPPTRAILDDEAGDVFYQMVVQDNRLNSLMHRADVYSTLMGYAAIEAVPAQGLKPIRTYLWDASQLIVRPEADDATSIGYVATRDLNLDGRLRYTLWSKDFRIVFVAKQSGAFTTSGGRSTQEVERTVNPYGRLPFAFIHADLPISTLTVPGLGAWLADSENAIDQARYLLGRGFANYLLPRPWVGGVESGWQPVEGDEYLRIPAGMMQNGSATPTMGYLQPSVDFQGGELHVDRMVSRVLEAAGIPESLYILEQTTAISGDALEAQARPIVDRTRNRQESLRVAEGELAEVILAVGGTWLGRPELRTAGLGNSNITVEWPADLVSTPGVDQDTQDRNALALGVASLVDVTRQRYRLSSDEEAVRRLLKVKEDNRKLAELGILSPPAPTVGDPGEGVFSSTEIAPSGVLS